MADRADSRREVGSPATAPDSAPIEAYQTDDSVVLYDSRNPLAWIESTCAIVIDDAI